MKNKIIDIYRKLFAKKYFYKLNIHLIKILFRGIGILNSDTDESSGENNFLRKISKLWQPKIVVDVGSNTDAYGYQFFKKATIYAIEPHPETYQKLKKKFSNKHRVKKINLAISDKNGKSKIWDFADDAKLKHTQPTSQLSSLNKEVITKIHKQKAKSFNVQISTLDSFTTKQSIKNIDFLKIDTEGNELKVLNGAKKLIKDEKIKMIQFEFNEMNALTRTFFYDFMKLLKNYNFYRILPNSLLPIDEYKPLTHEIFGFQNILTVNKKETKLLKIINTINHE